MGKALKSGQNDPNKIWMVCNSLLFEISECKNIFKKSKMILEKKPAHINLLKITWNHRWLITLKTLLVCHNMA